MDNLTISDIDILTDSLSLWEQKMPPELRAKSVVTIAESLSATNREDATEAISKLDEMEKQVNEVSRARMESSAMLKVKLITIKNQLVAEAIT